MLDKIQSFFGFTTMPFGRGLAPACCSAAAITPRPPPASATASPTRGITVITGEVGVGKTVAARAAIDRADPPATT